jgi:hypothetical protein
MLDPALILRRANISRKGGSWQHEDYDVFDGEREVGRIYLMDSDAGAETWFWGVSFQLTGARAMAALNRLRGPRRFRAEYLAFKGCAA